LLYIFYYLTVIDGEKVDMISVVIGPLVLRFSVQDDPISRFPVIKMALYDR